MKTTLVIYGITGDLSTRKLLPALESIFLLEDTLDVSIIGVSRRQVDLDDLMSGYPTVKSRTTMLTLDLANLEDYQKLSKHLTGLGAGQTLHYLSVPPGAAASIVDLLGEAGVNTPDHRILFEKPFGFDELSAREFIARTERYFKDEQLYRIDHYMAKEVALEIMRIRREATDGDLKKKIAKVTIVASEKIGIEGRAQFYEQTGALRDFVQGHLMQLLALALVRKPTNEPLPVQRLRALESILPADPEKAVRGQYEGYQDEAENPGSRVETFVSLELRSTEPEWADVPLQVVTGKALNEKRSYIQLDYDDGSSRQLDEEVMLLSNPDRHLDAYERVLLEAVNGRKDIFITGPEVVRSWEILAPVQQNWSMDESSLVTYRQGDSINDILL